MKKLIIFFTSLLISLSTIFALPGFKQIIPDIPGEYIYYRDLSFERESYIGFLTYDPQTFSARYYAPAEKEAKLPEKEVQIFFTINPKANRLELTGEKVLNIKLLTSEDLEIVNYMHDLLYEFTARRIKLVENNVLSGTQDELEFSGKITSNENFAQFGGTTQINWNTIIPLFNIESIYNEDEAKKVFSVATIGRISSNEDKSFENFKGFFNPKINKNHKNIKIKKAPSKEVQTPDGQSFVLDKNWTQKMENLFVYGDNAIVAYASLPNEDLKFIHRQMLLSSESTFLDWQTLKSSSWNKKDKNYIIEGIFYDSKTSEVTKNIKIITPLENGYSFFSITTFLSIYEKNKKYFDAIVSSYKTK